MPASFSISAPAKINLALAVAPPEGPTLAGGTPNPRAGWHRISSLFSCIDLADTLHLRRLSQGPSKFSLQWASDAPRQSPIDWPIEKDFAFRAHALLEKHVQRELPVEVVLEKRIPVGGGLGGGSSDAAAMLIGLSTLFELNLSPSVLAPVAAKLGSDIAFFLDEQANENSLPRPALVEGFGDRIERRSSFAGDVVLIIPPVGCPTPAVYRAFDAWLLRQPGFEFQDKEVRSLFRGAGAPESSSLFNDLADPAFNVAPAVREIQKLAERVVAPIHLTGSGSTLFVLLPPGKGAMAASELVRALGSQAGVVATWLV